MDMRLLLCLLLIVFTCVFTPTVMAQDKMVTVPESTLTAAQKASVAVQDTRSWVGLGKEIGEATNDALGAITTNADAFSKTGVGHFVMFMVAWKVLGNEALRVMIGLPIYLLMLTVWCWSYNRSCMTRSVLIEVTAEKTKKYKVINGSDDRDLNVTRGVHAAIICVTSGIMLVVMFA